MARLGKTIYTNSWDYNVCAVPMRDINTTRYSVDIYVVAPDGKASDLHTITRKDFLTNKKALDFLLDLHGDFTQDDVIAVKNRLSDIIKQTFKVKESTIQSKVTMEELHQKVSDYIRINAEELEDNSDAEVFIRGDYAYMLTTKLKEFVNEYKEELGHKKLEILKRLKVMGVLETTKNRPYDILVSVNGVKKRYYKIKLADEQEEEREEEVINIGHQGV